MNAGVDSGLCSSPLQDQTTPKAEEGRGGGGLTDAMAKRGAGGEGVLWPSVLWYCHVLFLVVVYPVPFLSSIDNTMLWQGFRFWCFMFLTKKPLLPCLGPNPLVARRVANCQTSVSQTSTAVAFSPIVVS